jgi:hypothetical protein
MQMDAVACFVGEYETQPERVMPQQLIPPTLRKTTPVELVDGACVTWKVSFALSKPPTKKYRDW